MNMWQVTAVKVALSSGSQGQKLDSVLAKPLKTQAFASPDKVAELVQKVPFRILQYMMQECVFSFLQISYEKFLSPKTGCRCYSTRFAQSNDQDEVVFAKSIYSDDLIQTYQVRISTPHIYTLFLPSEFFKEFPEPTRLV